MTASRHDADIAVLGAGCAGLSLAAALAQSRVDARILLIEPRVSYERDRTWCFWDTDPHPFSGAISHRWNAWRVSNGLKVVRRVSQRYRYCHIPGDAFYEAALESVRKTPNQELLLGTEALQVAEEDNGVRIETDRGQIRAAQVFDSRPKVEAMRSEGLEQRFQGWHVHSSRACFDPSTVELMRFLPSDAGRIRFLYLLPFGPDEALVEMTYLDLPGADEPHFEKELNEWLTQYTGGGEWRVLRRERGCLPMTARSHVPGTARVHPIGIRGGRLKPSSGYAFMRIQKHSRAIAEAIRDGSAIPASAEPKIYKLLDGVFLRALRDDPEHAEDLFLSLFERAESDSLIRFLSEVEVPLLELFKTAGALPKARMIRAAFSAAARYERRELKEAVG